MAKLEKIDLGPDRLISIAADALDDHKFITALKMLNKNAILNGNDEDSFMLYAEIFDDMELYEKSVNGWFKYLDYAEEVADFEEAYEGLAIGYMNLGRESVSAYYYNKLLMETNASLTPENRQEIINSFIKSDKPTLHFAYPPQLADYSAEIEGGIRMMRSGDYGGAIEYFEKVSEGNEKYPDARNYIAMCHIINDKLEEAEQECAAILKNDPSDVQALTTLAAVKTQQNKNDEALEIAGRLLSIKVESPADIYKIVSVCCENKLHAQAYELLKKLREDLPYDFSILYFSAISAYNCGKIEESNKIFDLILTIYPNAITAEYWKMRVNKNASLPEEKREELEYFYRLPKDESETNLEFLSVFSRLTDKMCARISAEADVENCVRWCFDEGEGNDSYELKLLGAICAVKAELNDTVRDILLDAFLPDGIKIETVNALVQRNGTGDYGIVICSIFKRISLIPLQTGRNKRKTFLRAYAMAFSRLAVLSEDYGGMLNQAACNLYEKLEREGRLDEARSAQVLAAAIVKSAGINEEMLPEEALLSFFGADKEKVQSLLG